MLKFFYLINYLFRKVLVSQFANISGDGTEGLVIPVLCLKIMRDVAKFSYVYAVYVKLGDLAHHFVNQRIDNLEGGSIP